MQTTSSGLSLVAMVVDLVLIPIMVCAPLHTTIPDVSEVYRSTEKNNRRAHILLTTTFFFFSDSGPGNFFFQFG